MSTKTLRKRIALVAVSAMGFGLLTSVSANAAHTAGTFAGTIGADGTSTVVASFSAYCADTTVVGTADSIVIPVGTTFTTTVASDKKAAVITGSAISYKSLSQAAGTPDTAASTSISAGGRLSLNGALAGAGDAVATTFTLSAIAVGSASIIYAGGTDADVTSSTANTLYITVVASCTSATYSATYSDVSTTTDGTDDTWTVNVDDATTASAGQSLYVRMIIKNEYDAAVTTGTYAASATNGALVNFGGTLGTAPSKGTTSVLTTTDANGQLQLRVNPASSANGGTTVVTVTLNGVTVATKTLTFLGEAKKIVIGTVKSGKTSTTNGAGTATGFFTYTYQDTNGNTVPGAAASFVATSATTTVPTATSEKAPTIAAAAPAGGLVDALETAIGATTVGVMNYDCGATAGSSTITILHTNAITGADLTATVPVSCAGGIDTYTVSTDKSSYKVGEIATITITAKDSKGNPVADSTAMAVDTVSVGGGSLTKAVAATDLFSAGVRTYKAQMTTAGTFNTVVSLTGTTTTSATTGYTVTDGSTSMTEVLAAIVSLIGSINKQIAALQKALTKKK